MSMSAKPLDHDADVRSLKGEVCSKSPRLHCKPEKVSGELQGFLHFSALSGAAQGNARLSLERSDTAAGP